MFAPYVLGGVPFIEQGPPSSSLRASDSASSSISSPTTTDSGLDSSAKGTSREDLSDLDQCSSSATTPSSTAALPATDLSSPDAQVLRPTILDTLKYAARYFFAQPWQPIWCLFFKKVIFFPLCLLPSAQGDNRPAEPPQSTSVESIPEVLEDKESSTEQSDTASVHDIDYVNPRGVRFTQSTQRDGESYVELQGEVLMLQKNCVPLIFNLLSQLNQTLASLEHHGDL